MTEYIFDVTYTSRGYMIVEADSEAEAMDKAGVFDCVSDTVRESDFDNVDLSSCELND